MRSFDYAVVDVFTDRALEGNAVAVFTDARALREEEFQRLARETNLSETTFILPRDAGVERAQGVKVRIFTVAEELPFAGHPTLGTAFALRGQSAAPEVKLDLNVGMVPVRFEDAAGQPTLGEMTQMDPVFGETHDPRKIAEVTGVPLDHIDSELPIQTVSTGVPFTILPLLGLEGMRKLKIDLQQSSEYLSASGGKFFFCVTRETLDRSARLHARLLMYGTEDPATGSASGCAAAWMVRYKVAQPDERVLIEQGIEMNRPSRIFVRASRRNDRVVNVRVGGNVVEVLRGEFFF